MCSCVILFLAFGKGIFTNVTFDNSEAAIDDVDHTNWVQFRGLNCELGTSRLLTILV